MPMRCQICVHPKRAQIERECLNGVAQTTVARNYDNCSHDSLWRHMRSHLKRPSPGALATRDSERHEMNERVVAGVRSTLAKELRQAVDSGNTAAVASLSRELLRTIDASMRLGDAAGTEGENATAEPCVVIHRDDSGEPLEPAAYARWYGALLPPDRYERWFERRQLPGAVEVALPFNGREAA
jgi:hypothetical protein